MDDNIAADYRAAGCGPCGGVLHAAWYQRKPRGRPAELGDIYDQRFSFCWAQRECRKRTTPPSLRFLGRKVYHATVVMVVSAMQHGARFARRQLSDRLGVSPRTVARWRHWWAHSFTASPFWHVASAGHCQVNRYGGVRGQRKGDSAASLCMLDVGLLSPDPEGLGADASTRGCAHEMAPRPEVAVDPGMGGQEPLCLNA
jgi:hypothetical protein